MRMPEDLRRVLVQAHLARLPYAYPPALDPRLYRPEPGDVVDGNTYNLPGPSAPKSPTSIVPENHRNTPYNLLAPWDRYLPPWITRKFQRNFYDYDLVERPNPLLPTWNDPNIRMPARPETGSV